MKALKPVIAILIVSIFLFPSSGINAQSSATVENFFGEGSFMDGYDFSAYAVQRVDEYGIDNPSLYPDFYFGDGNMPVETPDYHSPRPVINYGAAALNTITEIPDPYDSRFSTQSFVQGYTYGMFTWEGDYVVLQVTSIYQTPYSDHYINGMTFDWMYVEGVQSGGVPTITLYPYDKPEFALGESPTIGGDVLVGGQPVPNADVCPEVRIDDGTMIYGACHYTDANGHFSLWLEYGTHIPTGYGGNLEVWANVLVNDWIADQTIYVPYGSQALDQPLELDLIGPTQPIEIGGWEDIAIAGTVTSQGYLVDGALVTMNVAGQSFQTTTGTHTSGQFNWYWTNNSFAAGEYTVEVTVSKDGYQSVTKSVPFTLIGQGYTYWVTMDTIPAALPPGNQVPFPGALTLGGQPHYDWIEVHVTFPNGRTNPYFYETQSNGQFTHIQPAMNEVGTYQLKILRHDNQVQISDVYTWTVGSTATPTATATVAPTQTTPIPTECEIIEVDYPAVLNVNENINVTGKVICKNGDEVLPQEDWDVTVYAISARYESTLAGPTLMSGNDGAFSSSLKPDAFEYQEVVIIAHDRETNRKARWFGPLSVLAEIEPDITLSQTDYDQGEIVDGKLKLNPSSPTKGWDSGLEIYYQITGPVDGDAKQYMFQSRQLYNNGVDQFYWQVPYDAGAGKYSLVAFIAGKNIASQSYETEFYVNDIRHTNLSAVVEPAADDWSSGSLVGQFTDFEGLPIPNAAVRVVFVEEVEPHREFNLTGTTDEFGVYFIDLEPLDIFAGKGQEDPWENRFWVTTVYADKEGYATGATIITVNTPTASPNLEIISVDPPLDFIAEKVESGAVNYEDFLDMNIQVRVRYNNIFGEGAKLNIGASGNWTVTCVGANDYWATNIRRPHLSINGEQMPDWDRAEPGVSKYRNMHSWHVPGYMHSYYYWYPSFGTQMAATQGFDQEGQFTVSGQLFGHSFGEDSPNQCGTGTYKESKHIPPNWIGSEPVVKINVSLGSSQASVAYNASPPSMSASGKAWVSPTGGEMDAKLGLGQASGSILPNQGVTLSIIAKDIKTDAESPTSDLAIAGSAATDEKGSLKVPIQAQKNPCDLVAEAHYYVKVEIPELDSEKLIPIELRCIKALKFELSDIHVVQPVEVTYNNPVELAANKEAGVRYYFYVEGDIYPPANRPAQFDVKFEFLPKGSNYPLNPQIKTVSLTHKGASVRWSPKGKPANDTGIGEVVRFDNKPSGSSGREIVYVDFAFTPHPFGGTQSDYTIRITVDPEQFYGAELITKKEVTVKTMKHLQLMFVPVDVPHLDVVPPAGTKTDDQRGLIWRQVSFLQEVFPLGKGGLGWGISANYPSADMPAKWTVSNLDEICAALQKRFGSAEGGAYQFRIVGIVDPDTWDEGWLDYYLFKSYNGVGVHFKSSPQVVLLKNVENRENTLAHELGHTYGLYLDREQYSGEADGGNPVHGLIMRNGEIYLIPNDWNDSSEFKWIDAFGGKSSNVQRRLDAGKTYKNPFQIYDLMGNPFGGGQRAWVEPNTYNTVFAKLKDPPGDSILLVQGIVNGNAEVFLEPTWMMPGLPDSESDEGIYTLQALSSNGEVLYETKFGEANNDPNYQVPFFIQIPWISGIERLRVLEGEVVKTEQLRSNNPPQIDTSPSFTIDEEASTIALSWSAADLDGDSLTYRLDYQCEGAAFWLPLASDLTKSSYTFDTSALPGGNNCQVRLMATDGFNTVEAISDVFAVETKGPQVEIVIEETAYAGVPFYLQGAALDLEDGFVSDENLRWFSDVDGELGFGSSLQVELSLGEHLLTLQARDTDGNIAVAEVIIEVVEEPIEQPTTTPSTKPTSTPSGYIEEMPESGNRGLIFILIMIVIAGVLLGGGGLVFWLAYARKRKSAPATQPMHFDRPGVIQDGQGRYWYQDPNTRAWYYWDGNAWQIAQQGPSGL